MKRYCSLVARIVIAAALCVLLAVPALAAGKRVADPNNRNLAYNSPDKAASVCTRTPCAGAGNART